MTVKKTLLRKLSAVLLLLFPSSIVSFELSSARKKAWIHPNRVPLHIRCKADKLPQRSLHATSSPSADDTPKANPKLRPGSLAAATAEQGRVPYGEESRKYRRTVFTHSDWIEHRNSERVIKNLKGILFSGIVRQLREEINLVTGLAAFLVLWNGILIPKLAPWMPVWSLPSLPFTLSSPALGLLLVFRTNASYARWSEARTTWASIVSQSINMVRMSATFMDLSQDADKKSLERLSTATWLVCRTVMHELLGPEDTDPYRADLFKSLPPTLAERLLSMDDKTTAALTHASLSLDALPIDEKRRVEIDKSLVLIGNSIGTCQRIYSSPVPLVYSRHTARFLSLWMLLLPVALYEPFAAVATPFPIPALALIPAVAFVALFLFGIEELAVQLEEPFSILPMQQFCDSVRASSATIADWCARVDQDAK